MHRAIVKEIGCIGQLKS